MNDEIQMKIQAWVDGELSTKEAAAMAAYVATHPEAKATADSLRALHGAMAGSEVVRLVPETREFYFSTIQRGIELRDEDAQMPAAVTLWREWCRQWLVPVGGLAMLIAAILTVGPEWEGSTVNIPAPKHNRPAPAPAAITEAPTASAENEAGSEKINVSSLQLNGGANPTAPQIPQDDLRNAPSIENPDR